MAFHMKVIRAGREWAEGTKRKGDIGEALKATNYQPVRSLFPGVSFWHLIQLEKPIVRSFFHPKFTEHLLL